MIYHSRCDDCGCDIEENRPMTACKPGPCPDCGGVMYNVISGGNGFQAAFLGSAKNPGYHCVVADEYVTTKKRRNEIMRENDIRPHSSADTKGVHDPSFR